jgi:CDP-diacylglycerol--serine O-phosphatidyltransferase
MSPAPAGNLKEVDGLRKWPKRREIPFNKIFPNMITSGSILCGMLSLALASHGQVLPAAWLIAVAVVFDYLDGKVARSLGGSSAFGVELDSLADVISFGVVPAFLVYVVYMDILGLPGALVAAFFALCGALRLARFNVTHSAGSFQGLPIPAAGLALASIVPSGIPLYPWMVALICLFLGGLMVSAVPYGNLKRLRKGQIHRGKAALVLLVMTGSVVLLRERAPLALAWTYVVSGLVRFDWGAWLSTASDGEEVEEEA